MAFAGMAAGYVVFWIGARPSWLLALGMGLFFVLGVAYVGTRPLPRQEVGDAVAWSGQTEEARSPEGEGLR